MSQQITRSDFRALINQTAGALDRYAKTMPDGSRIEMEAVGEQFMFALMRSIRELADDEECAVIQMSAATFGSMHAGLITALDQKPVQMLIPDYERSH